MPETTPTPPPTPPIPISVVAAQAKRESDALNATVAIFQLDPRAREDLACYLRALDAAVEARDEEEQRYVFDSIRELFFPVGSGEPPADVSEWRAHAASTVQGRRAAEQLDEDDRRFLARYQDLKSKRGLETQQAVAAACGLSINTINAVETQRVKPQTRTLQRIAAGLGVSVEELLG